MAKKNINKPITDASEATLNKVVGTSDNKVNTEGTPGECNKTQTVADTAVKDETTPKNVFNTKQVAELVGNGSTNASASIASLRSASVVTFSGGADNIQGDESASVKGEKPRKSGDRPGRTLDTALRHIDDVVAETYSVPLNTIPQLRDGKSNVGYNGNYNNVHAITQKGSGGNPASNKFFRTLDVIEYDNLYYAAGQNVGSDVLEVASYDVTQNGYAEAKETFKLGNFLLRGMRITMSDSGALEDIDFDVDDLSIHDNDVTEDVFRLAGDAFLRNKNINEIDRLNMINVAGDESKDNWSPLGEVILDSSDANRVMKELEAFTGDISFVSLSKLRTALAYQINKSAKDGLRKIGPMFEAMYGNVEKTTYNVRHNSIDELDPSILFEDQQGLANGSAALFIALNDSTQKYNTKGKMLSLPLSFKVALDTAAKNCGSLMMHETLFNEFNRQEIFGKLDEDGSGITPTFLSDGAGIIMPIDINDTFTGIHNGKVDPMFTLHYEDIRNKYNYPVYNYFVQGLVDWFTRKSGKIVSIFKKAGVAKIGDKYILNVPVTSTTSCVSLWDLIVCDAIKDIAIERQYAMNLVLKYEKLNNAYPYSGLVKLDTINIGGSANVGFTDVNTPLSTRNVPLNVAVRLLMPEVFTPKSVETKDNSLFGGKVDVCQVIMPWYFNQGAYEPQAGEHGSFWALKAGDGSHMTFFDVRGGVTFGNVDRVLAMDPEQIKFCMDRMVDIPGRHAIADYDGYNAKTYKYTDSDDGMIVSAYHAFAKSKGQADKVLTIKDILVAPRELGLSFVAPAGILTPAYAGSQSNYRSIDSSYLGVSGPSFRLKYWHAADTVSNTLFNDNRDSSVEFNLKAKYDVIEATAQRGNTDIGIKLCGNGTGNASAIIDERISPFMVTTGSGRYIYDTAEYEDGQTATLGAKNLYLVSALKYLYTRVQLLPFIINPFDANTWVFLTSGEQNYTVINQYDDFDFLHLYNVCGFRDGEYSGTEFDRNRDRVEKGLGYVSDPYIERRL